MTKDVSIVINDIIFIYIFIFTHDGVTNVHWAKLKTYKNPERNSSKYNNYTLFFNLRFSDICNVLKGEKAF